MVNPAEVFDLAATVFGIAGLAGFAWAVFRVKGTAETIQLLKSAVDIERDERHVQEQRCANEVANLQGQVDVLLNGLADKLAEAVLRHLDERSGSGG